MLCPPLAPATVGRIKDGEVDDGMRVMQRDYQSAFLRSFFLARNMLKRAFVDRSFTPRFTSSFAVGLGSALPPWLYCDVLSEAERGRASR